MDQLLYDFVRSASIVQKGVFLMVTGVCFVFIVQFVFYITVKIWLSVTKKKSEN